MKIFIAVAVLLALSGCSNPISEWTQTGPFNLKTIRGFEDCTLSTVWTGNVTLYMVRCPNSTVSTTRTGKNPIRTITVDGVEYTAKEK
jgi:hypothetical protein